MQHSISRTIFKIFTITTLAFSATNAYAGGHGDVSWSISVGSSRPSPVYAPPPVVYVQPQPVYVQPHPVYVHPQPVYVQPRPVYVQPQTVYVQPGTVVQIGTPYYVEKRRHTKKGRPRHWEYGHEHREYRY